jgi:hypothetical protein
LSPALGQQVPSGAELHLRLTSSVGSATSKPKDPVRAVLISPLVSADRTLVPAGAELSGEVREVLASSAPESEKKQARVWLSFTRLHLAGTQPVSIAARLTSVDNARETVDADGRIIGIDPSQTLSSQADRGINKLSGRFGSFASILEAAKGAIVKQTDPEITYPPGVEFSVTLLKPITLTPAFLAAAANAAPKLGSFNPNDLQRMVADQPIRANAAKPAKPSDLTNIILIGTQESIANAFTKAGWTSAAALDAKAKLETARAIIEDRGYKEGPVSLLYIDNRPPDMTFEKTNDTFDARHHLRLWRRPGTFNSLPIWIMTATHDTAIQFSEADRTFIHKIDPHIDAERAKVVADLLFASAVRSIALVERTGLPQNPTNATGDPLLTDGRIAVLQID